jgi:hypothetical protein
VNHELLRVVIQQEHALLRRESGWDLWFVPIALWMAAVAWLVIFFMLMFVVSAARGWLALTVWDYVVTGAGIGAMLVWPVAYWLSYRRQAARERAFGTSLQDEIRRNLSRVDYHLSRYGRLAPSLMMLTPFAVVALLFIWGTLRTDEGPFSGRGVFIVVAFSLLLPFVWTGNYFRQRLLEQRRQLNQLLELLDKGE